jgi:hypothetical protein
VERILIRGFGCASTHGYCSCAAKRRFVASLNVFFRALSYFRDQAISKSLLMQQSHFAVFTPQSQEKKLKKKLSECHIITHLDKFN